MTELYKKVYIRSEEDLPKKEGRYFVKRIHIPYDCNPEDPTKEMTIIYEGDHYIDPNTKGYVESWLKYVSWYLQPLELPTDEEIIKILNIYSITNIGYIENTHGERTLLIDPMDYHKIATEIRAKWLKEQLLK